MNYRSMVYLAPLALLFSVSVKANVEEMADVGHLRDTIRNNENVVIKVYADWCGHCKHAAIPFKELATEHKEHIKSVAINHDNDDLKSIVQKFGVNGFPTFIFIKKEKTDGYEEITIKELSSSPLYIKKMVGFSHEDLKTRMKEFGTKVKKAARKAVHAVKSAFEKPFALNHAEDMEELKEDLATAFKHNKHFVIKVETSWCGACKAIAPEFKEMMEKHHKALKGAILDGENKEFTSLLGKKLKVQAYPTFIFIRQDKAPGYEEMDLTELHEKPLYVKTIRGFSEMFKRDLAVLAGVPGAASITVTRITEDDEKVAAKTKPAKKHVEKKAVAKKPVTKKPAKKHVKKHVEEAEPEVCSQD
jgi:thiol-disulfide isomerase/thioredoxin